MQKANGAPVLIASSGSSAKLERIVLGAGTHDEAWLQALIFEHPELLPISQIEPGFGVAIPAAREIACGHGWIDNLYLTATGEIILVETKLWRNVQARREVVAQALDYVSALMAMGYEQFEAAVIKAAGINQQSLYDLVAAAPEALSEAAFVDAVSRNLLRGRMLVIALGDGIRQEAETLAGLLQSHAGAHFTFALVELATWKNLDTGELLAVPNTLAQARMELFAEASEDRDPIHLDEVHARSQGLPDTIAHGFLTLSLIVPLSEGVVPYPSSTKKRFNYGVDKPTTRDGAPVPGRFFKGYWTFGRRGVRFFEPRFGPAGNRAHLEMRLIKRLT